MKAERQTTLKEAVSVSGMGVHSGRPATLTLYPADAGSGYVFVRGDAPQRELRADYRAVVSTDHATVLGDKSGPVVATAEHVLAALRGAGLDNALIEIDGPEAPILDGSAGPYLDAIERAGIETLAAPRRYLAVLKDVRVAKGGAYGELRPYAGGLRLEIEIEFDNAAIGRQSIATEIEPATFRRELARARTFGFMRDVSRLWNAGLALGASFDNTLVVSDARVLNPAGLRYPDEFVRHKALDALGDLALAGAPILGSYRSVCGGHALNHAMLVALMADPQAWAWVEAEPAGRPRGHAEMPLGHAAAAFGPEVS